MGWKSCESRLLWSLYNYRCDKFIWLIKIYILKKLKINKNKNSHYSLFAILLLGYNPLGQNRRNILLFHIPYSTSSWLFKWQVPKRFTEFKPNISLTLPESTRFQEKVLDICGRQWFRSLRSPNRVRMISTETEGLWTVPSYTSPPSRGFMTDC